MHINSIIETKLCLKCKVYSKFNFQKRKLSNQHQKNYILIEAGQNLWVDLEILNFIKKENIKPMQKRYVLA